MDNPAVSIIVPTKDRSALLMQAIESVRAQTFTNWELIVADDGSTDDTMQKLEQLQAFDGRIRALSPGAGRPGAPARRNDGFSASAGQFVIFLDDDDQLAPECLQHRVWTMTQAPSLDFAIFPCGLFVNEPGDQSHLQSRAHALLGYTGREADLDLFLALDFPFNTTSPIWRREAFARLGPWDESLKSWQDLELGIRALALGLSYKKFPVIDYYYRILGPNKRLTTGVQAKNLDQLATRRNVLGRITHVLRTNGLLDAKRTALVAGLYFFVAEHLARGGRLAEALQIWRAARQDRLVSWSDYFTSLYYLRSVRMGRTHQLIRARLRRLHPEFFEVGIDRPAKAAVAPMMEPAA